MRIGECTTAPYQSVWRLFGMPPSVLAGVPSTDAQQLSRGAGAGKIYKVELTKDNILINNSFYLFIQKNYFKLTFPIMVGFINNNMNVLATRLWPSSQQKRRIRSDEFPLEIHRE